MGLDASRDEVVAIPTGSHQTTQTLTRIIPSNFPREYCFATSRIESKCVKDDLKEMLVKDAGLPVNYIVSQSSKRFGRETKPRNQ